MAFFRRTRVTPLSVSMSGVEMGQQLLVVGCADRALLVEVASRVGLSGRAAVVVFDDESAAAAARAAERGGILVDVEKATGGFSFESGTFDLAVVDNTGGLLSASRPETRVFSLQETLRVLRGGGRVLVVEAAPREGILGVLARARANEHFVMGGGSERALEAEGFAGVRVLAERDGRRFIEGVKRRGA
jgi:SAM-dependent methyltransferase